LIYINNILEARAGIAAMALPTDIVRIILNSGGKIPAVIPAAVSNDLPVAIVDQSSSLCNDRIAVDCHICVPNVSR
jgi:hypothetical protein